MHEEQAREELHLNPKPFYTIDPEKNYSTS